MARFTASIPLNIRLPGGFEVSGAAGATHRIPDELVEEFTRDQIPTIPGGVTWITQDESSAFLGFDPTTKYDKTGGTISGAVTITGALVAQAGTTVKTLNGSFLYADQYASIQAAHDALPATGGTIVVPAGTYTAATDAPLLEITKSNFRLLGAGPGATVFRFPASSTNKYLINSTQTSVHDVYIGGFTIDANGTSNSSLTGQEGIRFAALGAKRIYFENIYIFDMAGSSSDESLAINAAYITTGAMRGIVAENCRGSGPTVLGCTDFTVADCIAVNCEWGGIVISTAVATVARNVTVVNCVARGCRTGFGFESCSNVTFSNCVSDQNTRYGVSFGFSAGTPTTMVTNVVGDGLIVSNNGLSASATYSGVIIAGNGTTGCSNILLTGVRAYDSQASKTQHYGVQDAVGTSNCVIEGDLRGNLTGEADLTAGTNNVYRPTRKVWARVSNSANIAINNASTTLITFNTEASDRDGYHSTVSETGRFTVPVGLAGPHKFVASVHTPARTTGIWILQVVKNGTTTVGRATSSLLNSADDITVQAGPLDCAAGDYFEVSVFHSAGATINAEAQTDYSPVYHVERI